jgi:hypothetical protein
MPSLCMLVDWWSFAVKGLWALWDNTHDSVSSAFYFPAILHWMFGSIIISIQRNTRNNVSYCKL